MDQLLEGIAKLTEAARKVSDWADRSGLRLNAGKTKAIFFGSRTKVNELVVMQMPGIELKPGSSFGFATRLRVLGLYSTAN